MKYLLTTLILFAFIACSNQVKPKVLSKRNLAYKEIPKRMVVPDPGPQFVVLHPDIMERELEIDQGLTDLMRKLFWAGLLSPNNESDILLQGSDKQLVLDITSVNAGITEDFQFKAYLPKQKLNPNSEIGHYLIIHEWSLGYGITAQGFYDVNQSREVSEPEKARTLNSVLSYSVWDANKAQVIQHGVAEAAILRSNKWTTEDFKMLALQLNKDLHNQLRGVKNDQ